MKRPAVPCEVTAGRADGLPTARTDLLKWKRIVFPATSLRSAQVERRVCLRAPVQPAPAVVHQELDHVHQVIDQRHLRIDPIYYYYQAPRPDEMVNPVWILQLQRVVQM